MENEHLYPALTAEKKCGDERFLNGNVSVRLLDFWAWAYSDLVGNTERGKLAEYIVSLAMDCAEDRSEGWGAFDILSPEGIKIEVKTSAYLQSWAQKKTSDIRFGIRETLAWDSKTNSFAESARRQADVYVFCVENCKEQELVNPLDLTQWDFYPIATAVLQGLPPGRGKKLSPEPGTCIRTMSIRASPQQIIIAHSSNHIDFHLLLITLL